MVKLLKISLALVCLAICYTATAQVIIDIDEKINEKLRMKNASIDSTKVSGFRIQIEFSTNMNTATSAEMSFRTKFTDYSDRVYRLYQQPYWKIRVGDFYREIDAQQMLKEIRIYFPDAFVVRDYISRPKLIE